MFQESGACRTRLLSSCMPIGRAVGTALCESSRIFQLEAASAAMLFHRRWKASRGRVAIAPDDNPNYLSKLIFLPSNTGRNSGPGRPTRFFDLDRPAVRPPQRSELGAPVPVNSCNPKEDTIGSTEPIRRQRVLSRGRRFPGVGLALCVRGEGIVGGCRGRR
jgi:hypothetical protein